MLLLVGLLIGGCGTQKAEGTTSQLTGSLPVRVVARLAAGAPVTVMVGPVAAKDGTGVVLFAQGSYGMRVYQAKFVRNVARFALSGKETQQSGVVSFRAQSGTAEGSAYLTIEPGPAIEPLTPRVGARFIIADADHWSMTIVIPFDAFGNPIREGTPVQIQALHPQNVLDRRVVPIQHLLSWRRVYSRTKAGRTVIVAQVGQVHGFEGTLLEVPGWPVSFRVSADPQPLPADGRLLTTLRSEIIRDKYGNMMPDGTMVMYVVEAAAGSRSYIPAYTIDGIAETPYQAPRQAGKMRVHATVLGVESESYTLVFTAGPAIGAFPIRVRRDPVNKGYIVTAGPLLGKLGQYIPDGTPVSFQYKNQAGQTYTVQGVSDGGYASVKLLSSSYPAGTYAIEATAGSGRGSGTITLP